MTCENEYKKASREKNPNLIFFILSKQIRLEFIMKEN